MYIKILFRQYSRGGVKLCEALRRKSLFNSILPDKIAEIGTQAVSY